MTEPDLIEVTCDAKTLLSRLSLAARALPAQPRTKKVAKDAEAKAETARVEVPYIRLEAKDDLLHIAAANGGLMIEDHFPVTAFHPGVAFVMARPLIELVAELDGTVDLSRNRTKPPRLSVACGKTRSSIPLENPAMFPETRPMTDYREIARVSFLELSDAIRLTAFACLRDEMRANPILDGISLRSWQYHLLLCGADRARIASTSILLPNELPGCDIIVPHRVLLEFAAMDLDARSEVVLWLSSDNTHLSLVALDGALRLDTVLIDGVYPNMTAPLSQNYDAHLTLSADDLEQVVRLANVMARSDDNKVILDVFRREGSDWLVVRSDDIEMGSAEARVPVSVEGTPVRFMLDAKYLLEVTRAVQGHKRVVLSTRYPNSPVRLMFADRNDFTYVMMPRIGVTAYRSEPEPEPEPETE